MTDHKAAGRDELLDALYEAAHGRIHEFVEAKHVSAEIGMSEDDADGALSFFKQKGWIDNLTFGGTLTLTALGIERAEQNRARRELETTAAPAPILTVVELRQVEAALVHLDRADVAAHLAGVELAEYEAARATVDAQLRSPRPKRSIISESMGHLDDIAKQTSAGVAAAVITKLTGLL
jgi:hypothetical protein